MSIFAKHFVVRNSAFARALALFTTAGAVSAILASAGTASAARALLPATGCSYETDFVDDYRVVGNTGIGNQSPTSGGSGRARNLYCPMPDTAGNPRSSVTQLWVAGFDANNDPGVSGSLDGRVVAQMCGHDDWNGGAFCSTWVEVTSNTQSGIQYDTNIGLLTGASDPLPMFKNPSFANWYTNLVVALPRKGISGSSWLYGITTI